MTVSRLPVRATSAQQASRARYAILLMLSTTPGSLRLAMATLVLLSFLLWLGANAATTQFRHVITTVGVDSFPGIEAAGQIRAGLADMDANAANGFFSVAAAASHTQYEQDRHNIAKALVTASHNITKPDKEEPPLTTLVDGLTVYTGLVESARTLGYPKGLANLQTASDMMRDRLIPASDTLNTVNFDPLTAEYKGVSTSVGIYTLIFHMVGLLLLGVCIGTQVFLCLRTRRLFNLPLVVATVLLLGFLIRINGVFRETQQDLQAAKEDAFDSFHALWKAKADASEANADESYYLLEKPMQVHYQQEFHKKASLLADRPLTPQIVAAAQQASQSHQNVIFKGFFADILNNISYEAEQPEAMEVVRRYARYMEIDSEIRRLETSGKHEEALALCTGSNANQMNGAFDAFNISLDKLISLNKAKFTRSISMALNNLDSLPPLALGLSLAIGALSWFGITIRLREFGG